MNEKQNANPNVVWTEIGYKAIAAYANENKKLIRWDRVRELFYDDIFNWFYPVRPGNYRIRWNNAK